MIETILWGVLWGTLIAVYVGAGLWTSFTAGKYGATNQSDPFISGLATIVVGAVWPVSWLFWAVNKLGVWVESNRS